MSFPIYMLLANHYFFQKILKTCYKKGLQIRSVLIITPYKYYCLGLTKRQYLISSCKEFYHPKYRNSQSTKKQKIISPIKIDALIRITLK